VVIHLDETHSWVLAALTLVKLTACLAALTLKMRCTNGGIDCDIMMLAAGDGYALRLWLNWIPTWEGDASSKRNKIKDACSYSL